MGNVKYASCYSHVELLSRAIPYIQFYLGGNIKLKPAVQREEKCSSMEDKKTSA